MITISTDSAFILTLIILLPYLSISTMDLAIFSSTRTATPFWPFSPPVWIILTPSLVKSPSSFHLVSASPITSKFALFISLITLVSFPGLSMVRTFHVPPSILFFTGFIKYIFGIYRKVVSQVLPLSVFHETPSLALTSSVIRPSESSPLGLAYTGEDSVVHHDLCVQQGDLVKVVWWAIEQQSLFEMLATPFSLLIIIIIIIIIIMIIQITLV